MYLSICFILMNLIQACPTSAATLSDENQELINSLSTIQYPEIAQKMVRYHTQGSEEAVKDLFQEAEKQNKPRAQIFIANAWMISHRTKDAQKDFSTINDFNALEDDPLATHSIFISRQLYKDLNPEVDYLSRQKMGTDLFRRARNNGSVYAHLVKTITDPGNGLNFWHASKIRPYLDNQKSIFPELVYYYGKALSHTTDVDTELDKEGRFFIRNKNLPFSELRKKLSPLETFSCFSCLSQEDIKKLHSLKKQFKIYTIPSISNWIICELLVKQNDNYLGKISVDSSQKNQGKYKLVKTIKEYDAKLAPLISFMEDVMISSGSSYAVYSFR